jgi:hypothetical protein
MDSESLWLSMCLSRCLTLLLLIPETTIVLTLGPLSAAVVSSTFWCVPASCQKTRKEGSYVGHDVIAEQFEQLREPEEARDGLEAARRQVPVQLPLVRVGGRRGGGRARPRDCAPPGGVARGRRVLHLGVAGHPRGGGGPQGEVGGVRAVAIGCGVVWCDEGGLGVSCLAVQRWGQVGAGLEQWGAVWSSFYCFVAFVAVLRVLEAVWTSLEHLQLFEKGGLRSI